MRYEHFFLSREQNARVCRWKHKIDARLASKREVLLGTQLSRTITAHGGAQNSSFSLGAGDKENENMSHVWECLRQAHIQRESATFYVKQGWLRKRVCSQDLFADSRERVGNYVGSHLDTICLPSGFSVIYGLIIPTLPPHTRRLALRICRVSYLLVSPRLCAVVCAAKFFSTFKQFIASGNTHQKIGNQEGEKYRERSGICCFSNMLCACDLSTISQQWNFNTKCGFSVIQHIKFLLMIPTKHMWQLFEYFNQTDD